MCCSMCQTGTWYTVSWFFWIEFWYSLWVDILVYLCVIHSVFPLNLGSITRLLDQVWARKCLILLVSEQIVELGDHVLSLLSEPQSALLPNGDAYLPEPQWGPKWDTVYERMGRKVLKCSSLEPERLTLVCFSNTGLTPCLELLGNLFNLSLPVK